MENDDEDLTERDYDMTDQNKIITSMANQFASEQNYILMS